MTDDWYWAEDGDQRGPVGVSELTRLVRDGQVEAETPVWCAGFSDWQPAGRQPWFVPSQAVMPPPLFAAATQAGSAGVSSPSPGTDTVDLDPSEMLPCPACRVTVASQAVRCPSCHVGFLGGFAPSLRRIWPRARYVVLGLAAMTAAPLLGEGVVAALATFVLSVAMYAAFAVGYAKVVADRFTTLGESARAGGRWRESGRGSSGFFFFWSG